MPLRGQTKVKKRTQVQRRAERRGLRLRELAVKKATLLRYKKALLKGLDAWDFTTNFTSIPMLDLDISDYIEFSFEEGDSIGHIGDFLCGLQMYFPMVRNRLSSAWRMFKIWKKHERRLQATPIPPSLLRGLLGFCLQRGHLVLLLLLSLGYFGLLRTGELLGLRRQDLQVCSDCALIFLGNTKGGSRENKDEHIVIRQPQAMSVIRAYLRTSGDPADQIWKTSGQHFRSCFSELLHHFGAANLGFRPYSLRRGGATSLYRQGWPTENILILGRWKSTSSARTYIDDGLTQQASLCFSAKVQAKIACFSKYFPSFA